MAWSVGQVTSTVVSGAGTTGVSKAFTSNVTAGQVIVAAVNYGDSTTNTYTATFSDASANVPSWTQTAVYISTAETVHMVIGFGIAGSSAACTPKVAWSAGTGSQELYIGSFTSPGGTITADGTASKEDSGTGGNQATIVLPAGPGAGASDLLINLASVGNTFGAFAGSWVAMGASQGGDACGYLLNAAGNSTPDWTQSPSGAWACLVLAIQATGAAATIASFIPHRMPLGC